MLQNAPQMSNSPASVGTATTLRVSDVEEALVMASSEPHPHRRASIPAAMQRSRMRRSLTGARRDSHRFQKGGGVTFDLRLRRNSVEGNNRRLPVAIPSLELSAGGNEVRAKAFRLAQAAPRVTPLSLLLLMMSERKRRLTNLVQEHLDFVERVMRNLGVPESELDDAVQRAFMVVADRLDDIRPGAERGFLFQTARYLAAHVWRNRARRLRDEQIDEHLPSDMASPETMLGQKNARELLDRILDAMPIDLRTVFVLHEFEELSGPEIATMLDIPLGTASSRLRRARKVFQMHINRLEAASRSRLKVSS